MDGSEVNVRSERYCEQMFNVLRHVIAREVGQELGAKPACEWRIITPPTQKPR